MSVSRETNISGQNVSRETHARLAAYVAMLLQWSTKINLISRRDHDVVWPRHIADALQLAPFLADRDPPGIDLGSGAGLPGLVLAIATGFPFHLIEADQRKAAFLREAARITAAPVTIHASRIEATPLPRVSVITARALAPLPLLLELAAPFLRQDGICLFLKGRTAQDELTAAAPQWHMRIERTASLTDPTASILKLSELRFAGPGRREH